MIPVSLKHNVKLEGMTTQCLLGMMIVTSVYDAYGIEDIVFTSVSDGKHGANSLHYSGNAFDVRIWAVAEEDLTSITRAISQALGDNYDVVLEDTHIHCEYDPA